MSGISIPVTCSPGSDIGLCVVEMLKLATRTGVTVESSFNEVTIGVHPDADISDYYSRYMSALKSKTNHKIIYFHKIG